MAHVRKQLRDAVASAVSGLTTTSTRVYKGRVVPLVAAELPSLSVFTASDTPVYEAVPGSSMGAPKVVRDLEVRIVGAATATTEAGVLDTLDLIAEQVETAIYLNPTYTGKALRTELGPQEIETNPEGDAVHGTVTMVFHVFYRVAEGVPGTAT